MADQPSPRRRRFQFRLRTLMIGVTLLAVPLGYIGWQAKIVSDRLAMRNEIRGLDGGKRRGIIDRVNPTLPKYRLPWLRVMLGDVPYAIVGLEPDTDKEYRQRVRDTFPEAVVKSYKRVITGPHSSTVQFVPFPDEPPRPDDETE
jgi:hypothetical protein